MNKRKITAALAVTVAATFALAACSSVSGDQSATEACASLAEPLAQIPSLVAEAGTDGTQALADSLSTFTEDFGASLDTVKNSGIKEAAKPVYENAKSAAKAASEAASDSSSTTLASLQEAAANLQTSYQELLAACTE